MNILDVVFPKRCLGCGKVGKYFCTTCASSVRPIAQYETICPVCEKPAMDGITHPSCKTRYNLDGLTSFFHYQGVVQKAVKSLKYRFVSDLAQEFVGLIFDCHSRPASKCGINYGGNPSTAYNSQSWIPGQARDDRTMLIPIPLHPSRFRYRGFNQAEKLGTIVAQRFGVTMRPDVLKRVVKTMSQVEVKDREKRLKNMEKAFVVNKVTMQQSNNATILLFDDVWTTGATIRSAGNALKRAGAAFVWAVTMAR